MYINSNVQIETLNSPPPSVYMYMLSNYVTKIYNLSYLCLLFREKTRMLKKWGRGEGLKTIQNPKSVHMCMF